MDRRSFTTLIAGARAATALPAAAQDAWPMRPVTPVVAMNIELG
jgi:hypothetical protein